MIKKIFAKNQKKKYHSKKRKQKNMDNSGLGAGMVDRTFWHVKSSLFSVPSIHAANNVFFVVGSEVSRG